MTTDPKTNTNLDPTISQLTQRITLLESEKVLLNQQLEHLLPLTAITPTPTPTPTPTKPATSIIHDLLDNHHPLNVNYAAQTVLQITLRNSSDMVDVLHLLTDRTIETAARSLDSLPSSSTDVQNHCRLLSLLGSPPSSLSLQQSYLRIASTKSGVHWRDGRHGTPVGPFRSKAEALQDACTQFNPREIILRRCLHTLQSKVNEPFMTLPMFGVFRCLGYLYKEGLTPKQVVLNVIERLCEEPIPVPVPVMAVLSEIVSLVLCTSPQLISPMLGKKIETVLKGGRV